MTTRHFAGSAVRVGQRARRVTIETGPQRSTHLGDRRIPQAELPDRGPAGACGEVYGGAGDERLRQRPARRRSPTYSSISTAKAALGPSGSFESWTSGVLYERVHIDGAGLRLTNDSSRSAGRRLDSRQFRGVEFRCRSYRGERARGRPQCRDALRRAAVREATLDPRPVACPAAASEHTGAARRISPDAAVCTTRILVARSNRQRPLHGQR